jgi:hypothetical protein
MYEEAGEKEKKKSRQKTMLICAIEKKRVKDEKPEKQATQHLEKNQL